LLLFCLKTAFHSIQIRYQGLKTRRASSRAPVVIRRCILSAGNY
jgi:hypothetical protein